MTAHQLCLIWAYGALFGMLVFHFWAMTLPESREIDPWVLALVSLGIIIWPLFVGSGLFAVAGVLFAFLWENTVGVLLRALAGRKRSAPAVEQHDQGPYRTAPPSCPTCGQMRKDVEPVEVDNLHKEK